MLELVVKMLLAYMLGSVSGSLVTGKFYGGVDIRTMGSGNAGGTNALRTQGKLFALWVILIDVLKGSISAGLIAIIAIPVIGIDPDVSRDTLRFVCGAAAVVGHCYPMWYRFKGGKGAATLIGVIAVIKPVLLLPVLLVWGGTLVLTGYVGIATIMGAVSAPVVLLLTGGAGQTGLIVFAIGMALFIIFTHRSNIVRLREGTEHRAKKAMLFRR